MFVRSRIVNILNKFVKIKRNILKIKHCTDRKKFAIFGHKWIFARERVKRVSKRKCWVRDRVLYVRVQGHAWYQCTLALGVNVLGNSPAFDCSCSVPVFVRRSPPNTPGRWYGSHFWLPKTPSLFHAWSVDSRIWRSQTCYCPEFAREAMTSTYRLF
jgi:hypothetical protein